MIKSVKYENPLGIKEGRFRNPSVQR